MRRVVADTNVLVSAIQFGGKPKQLLDLAADGYIDLTTSEAILEETLRVLRDKFRRARRRMSTGAHAQHRLCSGEPILARPARMNTLDDSFRSLPQKGNVVRSGIPVR